jgi:hypothetical protein
MSGIILETTTVTISQRRGEVRYEPEFDARGRWVAITAILEDGSKRPAQASITSSLDIRGKRK